MPMPRWCIAGVFLQLAVGCASQGVLVSDQLPHQHPLLGQAWQNGTYALFEAGRDDPLFTVSLTAGQPLGFGIEDTGTVGDLKIQWLCAVAGDRQIHVDANGHYQWRRL
jgi:hypothetical protein